MLRNPRSLLFAPGSSEKMLAKAQASDADALIFDLEDAVAAHVRPEARRTVAAALDRDVRPLTTVRVNHPSTADCAQDLDAIVGPNVFGIVLPKAESPDDVHAIAAVLDDLEPKRGVESGSIVILPLLESGLGLHFAYEIGTASERVTGLAFSSGEEGDFMADIDAEWTPDAVAMLYPRSKTVCETRAAGRFWSVDGVFMKFNDEAAFARDCRLSRSLGFQARMAIHPKQIATIHDIFTPSPEEIARQEAVIAAFEAAEKAGLGAVQHEGHMVDKANVEVARRVLARRPPDDGDGTDTGESL